MPCSRSQAGTWTYQNQVKIDLRVRSAQGRCFGYLRAAELILLGQRFDASRAAELGLVTRVVPDQALLATATETAQKLATKPAGALQASKKLMRSSTRQQLEDAMRAENEEFTARLHSAEAKEALTAFLEERPPDFRRATETIRAKKAS